MLSIYTNSLFYRHRTGAEHPETPERLDAALAGIQRAGLVSSVVAEAPLHGETDRLIAKVHSPDYERKLEEACRKGERYFHSLDNPISSESFTAARAAAGIALAAADDVWKKKSVDRAFVVARPPGHHAERQEAMGFCFFNTIACVAERLRELPGIERVLVFDWDVHHGNGTQHIFQARDDVYYVSMHQYPFYPGTGAANEIGVAEGRGFTRNLPLEEGTGDAIYLKVVEQIVVRIIDDYRPQALLLSAGFDAHFRDPLGGMRVTEGAFGEMTQRMIEAASRHGEGRILSLFEGGYDPEGIAASVAAHVEALKN